MRACLLIFLGLFLIACKEKDKNLIGAESYYWYFEEKIPVQKHYHVITIPHTDGLAESDIPELLGVSSKHIIRSTRVHNSIWRVEFTSPVPSRLPDIAMPTIFIAGSRDFSMLTGEISIKPNSQTDITAIAAKYSLTPEQTTSYGTYLYRVAIPAQTLETANKIQENENLEWSAPNMISPFSNQ